MTKTEREFVETDEDVAEFTVHGANAQAVYLTADRILRKLRGLDDQAETRFAVRFTPEAQTSKGDVAIWRGEVTARF